MRIAVGLSGGVDSAAALALLKSQGHDVFGITMKIWDSHLDIHEGKSHACYGPGEAEDVEVCERITKQLKVPYYAFDLSQEYNKSILDYFRSEYLAGRTPNPCVKCNYTMKFGFLLREAQRQGLEFDAFATGHYARIERVRDSFYIKKATFLKKDQSYFLYRLSDETLQKVIFPLGTYTKPEVRQIASAFNLEVAQKPESQDFIAGGYQVLFPDNAPGDIVDENGKVLGRHQGITRYTIGQHRGLGLSLDKPYFVKEIDAAGNRIIVSDNESLFARTAQIHNCYLKEKPLADGAVYAKIRYNHEPARVASYTENNGIVTVEFEVPQRGITPGQSLVLYQEDYVLGGGEIIY